ncbi:putative ABC transporter-binding protein precursor [Pseudovibrio axinellae]|uniref:Putative ABC transporter-binding protein n=1 Tax=Pseudovibrio axinellae TaxID=989403 RepID=A0A166AFN7_9HYPH|nr:ABC transporter substrate-binding protein [Pseudovibrio axinellae]KZL21006.1 putative ABC transporter-binding protein precursor [Pseudovibrio axinellae]SEP79290.1 peptide/nickel transport system substrate-binding protein [Pseudovibrio axinellae]
MKPLGLLPFICLASILLSSAQSSAIVLKETPDIPPGLPPVAERVPKEPLITYPEKIGREIGVQGGSLHTLIARPKDVRLINVWGYARLVGYDTNLQLKPDILESVDNQDDKAFTLNIREGHKWSDGNAFTAEDFRFWYEDVALNLALNPIGLPGFMLVDGEGPTFTVIDDTTVRFVWDTPNPLFLQTLAKARPPFIYRPAAYLKQFHINYGNPEFIRQIARIEKVRGWAPLFNRLDDMYGATNPTIPTLQPWVPRSDSGERRAVMERNPFFHRIDNAGQQLPYIDRVIMNVADGKLIPAKTLAGESDLQAQGLGFSDISVLKRGEQTQDYETRLWLNSKGSEISILPNLSIKDPAWRKLMQDRRFRHALSLGIDRELVNKVLYLGLGRPGNDTVLDISPLYRPHFRTAWAEFNPELANKLLDDIGLTERRGDGIRLLDDGRPLQLIIEITGERSEQDDALELVAETWKEIGVSAFIRPSQRDTIRARALSGMLMMSVWSGFENGVPTADMPPLDYAPTREDFLSWAPWGNYYVSDGQAGVKPDWPPAIQLIDLFDGWLVSGSFNEREKIWEEMLQIHAEETIHIGLVNGVRQPVVVKGLRNVPEEGIYGWDPGAQFGIHRMDLFFFTDQLPHKDE